MDFLELAKTRYSVREYEEKKVEKEKLYKILEAARVAPSAVNNQPYRLIVVESEEGLAKIEEGARLYKAPLAIIVCKVTEEAWCRKYDGKNHGDIDVSIVTDHMMMEATDLGLGTLWICWFKPEVIRKNFQIPEGIEPVNILAVGYAKDGKKGDVYRHETMRKKPEETVKYETF